MVACLPWDTRVAAVGLRPTLAVSRVPAGRLIKTLRRCLDWAQVSVDLADLIVDPADLIIDALSVNGFA